MMKNNHIFMLITWFLFLFPMLVTFLWYLIRASYPSICHRTKSLLMTLIINWRNKCFIPVHHLDELAVLLEGLQSVVGVVALQYVGLHAHVQDPSHHGGNFTVYFCLISPKWATGLFCSLYYTICCQIPFTFHALELFW